MIHLIVQGDIRITPRIGASEGLFFQELIYLACRKPVFLLSQASPVDGITISITFPSMLKIVFPPVSIAL